MVALLALDAGHEPELADLVGEVEAVVDILLGDDTDIDIVHILASHLAGLLVEGLVVDMHGVGLRNGELKGLPGLAAVGKTLVGDIVLIAQRAVGELLEVRLGILAGLALDELAIEGAGDDGDTRLLDELHLGMADDTPLGGRDTRRLLLSLLPVLLCLLESLHFVRLLLTGILLGRLCLRTYTVGRYVDLGLFGFLLCSHK